MIYLRTSIFTVLSILYGITASGWAADRIPVFVSIAPQAYFVQQIGKELVDVQVLVEAGADPHTYEPKPQQMVALSKAALYFAIGIEFETAKLEKITAVNPRMQVVYTDHGILKLPMAAHDHGENGHAEAHHHPDSLDPHIWLSPPLVMLQARSILTALQAADPSHRSTYEANYRDFMLDIVDLDTHLRTTFDAFKGSAFMVFHPSWGTFAHTYGLKQVPIEIQGKSPKPAQLKALIEHARSNRIKVIFAQPQFSSKSAQQIARAIDGRVVFVDPLAGDWDVNLRRTAEEFKNVFK
ncbi:metal ABC transporter solute-binding protein, Zn/Mn family [Desulfosarcina sp.]|uniref:metal ABC transporter solute-binding protein, Zn/Mn family n=1 Tax=Desulfosarcina sp. TaxID=2027861 RepID=UPI00397085FF